MKNHRCALLVVAVLLSLVCACSNELQVHEHTFSNDWSFDETSHWHASTCGHDVVSDQEKHDWNRGVITEEPSHFKEGTLTYTCTECKYTRTESIPVLADVHTFSQEWSYDETFHWHASTCGHDVVSGKAEHSWDYGVITKKPTLIEEGIKTFTCSECGNTRSESIQSIHFEDLFFVRNGILSVTYTSYLPASISLPDYISGEKVTSIGEYAFSYCTGLTEITIPDSVTSIGDYAFRDCKGLTGITIPDSVTSIGHDAFSYCTGLTEITIPDSVTSIGQGAFSHCTGLTEFTIPDSVTSIGEEVFYGWTNEQTIKYNYGNFSADSSTWFGCSAKFDISIPDSVTSIGDRAFSDCTGLTEITIPDSVTSIGSGAFYGCTGLTEITIPDSFTSIVNGAFYGCTGLTEITIPDSVTSIGYGAFYGCTGLTGITIPDSVTSIGVTAFSGCTGLTGITIPDSVTSIGEEVFYGCTGLTVITIPDSVTSIGGRAFSGCSNISSLYYSGTVSRWESVSKGKKYADGIGTSVVICSDGDCPLS